CLSIRLHDIAGIVGVVAHAKVQIEIGVSPQGIAVAERRENEIRFGVGEAVAARPLDEDAIWGNGRQPVPNVEEELVASHSELQPGPCSEKKLLLKVSTQ